MAKGAGLVLSIFGDRRFLPAFLVDRVIPMPRLSSVPGSDVKLALVRGRVISVLELGPASSHLVVCTVNGEPVGLSGLNVERSGFFEAHAEGVEVDGDIVTAFDPSKEVANRLGGAS
jgi:hypothetical protein